MSFETKLILFPFNKGVQQLLFIAWTTDNSLHLLVEKSKNY